MNKSWRWVWINTWDPVCISLFEKSFPLTLTAGFFVMLMLMLTLITLPFLLGLEQVQVAPRWVSLYPVFLRVNRSIFIVSCLCWDSTEKMAVWIIWKEYFFKNRKILQCLQSIIQALVFFIEKCSFMVVSTHNWFVCSKICLEFDWDMKWWLLWNSVGGTKAPQWISCGFWHDTVLRNHTLMSEVLVASAGCWAREGHDAMDRAGLLGHSLVPSSSSTHRPCQTRAVSSSFCCVSTFRSKIILSFWDPFLAFYFFFHHKCNIAFFRLLVCLFYKLNIPGAPCPSTSRLRSLVSWKESKPPTHPKFLIWVRWKISSILLDEVGPSFLTLQCNEPWYNLDCKALPLPPPSREVQARAFHKFVVVWSVCVVGMPLC